MPAEIYEQELVQECRVHSKSCIYSETPARTWWDQYVDVRYARGLCVLFKVRQGVHRGECVSSLRNLEPLVSHHITHLPPPCNVCWSSYKAPSSQLQHKALQALFCAGRHQTVPSFLTHWPQPQPAESVLRQDDDYHGLFVLKTTLNSSAHVSQLVSFHTIYGWKNRKWSESVSNTQKHLDTVTLLFIRVASCRADNENDNEIMWTHKYCICR